MVPSMRCPRTSNDCDLADCRPSARSPYENLLWELKRWSGSSAVNHCGVFMSASSECSPLRIFTSQVDQQKILDPMVGERENCDRIVSGVLRNRTK